MQNRTLDFFSWFRAWDFFFPFPQRTIANCTHVYCVTEGDFLITHSYLLLKKLCPCALDFLLAWSCSRWIFLRGNRNLLQMKSHLHIKSREMCGLSQELILFQSAFAWTCSQALLSTCLICLKKNICLQELASIFEYWLFFLSHKILDIFSKQWTRIALRFQCNYKFAPFFPF